MMKGMVTRIMASKLWWIFLLLAVGGINFIASTLHQRFDLTKEKRYTLSKTTKQLLRGLNGPVKVEVLVEGSELPAEVKRLQNAVREFLANCKEYSKGQLSVVFRNPYEGLGGDSLQVLMEDSLFQKYGLFPSTIDAPEKVGDKIAISKVIHGAILSYGDTAMGVNLLQGVKGYGTEKEQRAALYNDIEASLEYKFANAIQKITAVQRPSVGYVLGNGESWGYNVDDAVRTLLANYNLDTVNIKTDPYIPAEFDALVIMKPTIPFTDNDKLKIDQYVMNGGKVFWMIDNMYAEFDSLYQSGGFTAFDRGLNLDDLLFKYGVRINQNLLQDMQCDKLPQMSSNPGNKEQRLVDWPFFPILNGVNHPVSKNLDGVRAMFPNTIDTVKAAGIRKTILLTSSKNARVKTVPAIVDFEFMEIAPDSKQFTLNDIPAAVLLEGKFSSFYANTVSQEQIDTLAAYNVPFKRIAEKESKMIVVADGDVAMNQFSQMNGPLPMGTNLFTKYTFANKDFFINSLEYLVNPSNILETRAKEFTLRLLDPKKVESGKTTWQLINIALPVLLVILAGFVYQQLRKRKYAGA
jgi:ABC-2 type transport system permease protein